MRSKPLGEEEEDKKEAGVKVVIKKYSERVRDNGFLPEFDSTSLRVLNEMREILSRWKKGIETIL